MQESVEEKPRADANCEEDAFGGFVSSTNRGTKAHVTSANSSVGASTSNRSQRTPLSWAVGDDYGPTPSQSRLPGAGNSHLSSPPRLSTTSRKRRNQTTPKGRRTRLEDPDPLEPPELSPEHTFRGWLASGVLEALNVAAGVTLSTTELLLAPPLLLTKNMLLPGLLALFVDTLDTITPPRVQDWLRIVTSSVYHFFSVLRATDTGKSFSDQVVVVLQDVLQATSAPESRQVLVDGMATCVKFADALNTPEMLEWMEQLSVLASRLVDAAASGKTKQLVQDTKDLAWKGIQMATDPKTTLALAEVTAHLCHALDDTQRILNPTPRKVRNSQNKAVYLDPLQMPDFPEQATMEEIILSSLGRMAEGPLDEDDSGSIPSNVAWNNDANTAPGHTSERRWKEREVQVNVELLRDRILHTPKSKRSARTTPPAINALPGIPSNDEDDDTTLDEEEEQEQATAPHSTIDDLEDVAIPHTVRQPTPRQRLGVPTTLQSARTTEEPPVVQFYRALDDMLQARKLGKGRIPGENGDAISEYVRAQVKRSSKGECVALPTRNQSHTKYNRRRQPTAKRKVLILIRGGIAVLLACTWTAFALFGVYSFVSRSRPTIKHHSDGGRQWSPSPSEQELIIRVIREVVHVQEDGTIVGKDSLVLNDEHWGHASAYNKVLVPESDSSKTNEVL